MRYIRRHRRWPEGTWMRLISKDRLQRQMHAVGVSYSQLAEDASVSKGFISHLVKGRKTTCTPRVAEDIARSLGIDLEILFVPSVSIDTGRVVKQERKAA